MSDTKTIPDSMERVALELMHHVAQYEDAGVTQDKEYWLRLYWRCRKIVVTGEDPQRPR